MNIKRFNPDPSKVRATLTRDESAEVTDRQSLADFVRIQFAALMDFVRAEATHINNKAVTYDIHIHAPGCAEFETVGVKGTEVIDSPQAQEHYPEKFASELIDRFVGYALSQYEKVPPASRNFEVRFEAILNVFEGYSMEKIPLDGDEGRRVQEQLAESIGNDITKLKLASAEQMASAMVAQFLKENPDLKPANLDEAVELMMNAMERGEFEPLELLMSMQTTVKQERKKMSDAHANRLVDNTLARARRKSRTKTDSR